MAHTTITISVDESKLSAIDQLAEQMQLDRNSLLDEAVGNYLRLQEQQRASIERGIRQADAGQLIPHAEVVRGMEERIAAYKAGHLVERR